LLDAIESLASGFALFDPDERLVICNSKFRSAFSLIENHIRRGAKLEDMTRRYAEANENLHGNAVAIDGFVSKCMQHYRNATGNLVYLAPDGLWYRMMDHRSQDGGGVVIHTDITESKNREMQLLAAKDQADSVNQMEIKFLANMSHELRTPLNAIIGFSEMIGNEMFGPVRVPKYLEYIADIRQSGVHLLDVINDILDISKVESGTVVLEQASVDLGQIIETCHRLVMLRAEAKSLDLTIEIADTIPAIRGDRRRIIQLLLNLLANAIKFTEDGGNIVSWVVHMPSGEVAISVCDSGIGISAENIENAVEPFFQVDSSLARPHEGTGLGLTLSKMFAELHGGRLEITSEIGLGTTVTVRFPANLVLCEESEPFSQGVGT
jgi:signal transduction histidine kinase